MFLKILNKLSSMSQKKILAMAGVTGASMFGLVYATLSSAVTDKPSVEPQLIDAREPTVAIVAAASDIPAQTVIQESMLKLTEVPPDLVTPLTVRDASKLVGKVTRVDVLTDDILTEKKVFHSVEQAGMIGMIPSDCRAISIGISDVTSVSGFINPGDHVDVMMVCEVDDTIHSEIILQNVLLLAMGKKAVQTDKGILESAISGAASGVAAGMANAVNNTEKSSSTATLALHADEILQVAAAARKGTLYLVMRPFRPEQETVDTTDYSLQTWSDRSSTLFDRYEFEPVEQALEVSTPASMPAPAFEPPPSPVVDRPAPTFQPPRVTQPPVGNPAPSEPGIEIIQGDQITSS